MIALADGDTVTDPVLSDGASAFTPGLSVRSGGSSRFLMGGRMGTATKETDSAQTLTATRTYDAFGNMVSSLGSSPSVIHSKGKPCPRRRGSEGRGLVPSGAGGQNDDGVATRKTPLNRTR